MKKIISFFIASFIVLAAPYNSNACIPAAAAPVFQTIDASSNAFIQVTNMPTGNVLQIIVTVPNTRINFNFCVTNVGTVPSGTNDGYATILDKNSALAAELGSGNDGCANVLGDGYGPPLFEFTFTYADTFYLYLTEYDPSGNDQCFGNNGSNSDYDADIDVIVPPDFDAFPEPNRVEYTQIPTTQIVPFTLGGKLTNIGISGDNVDLFVDIFKLPNTTTPVQSYTSLTNPVPPFSSVTVTAGTFTPSTAGDYSIRYVTTSVGDANAANDTVYVTFTVSTDLFARDNGVPFNFIATGGQDVINIVQRYNFTTAADIPSVYLGLVTTTAFDASDSIGLEVYSSNGGTPDMLLASSPMQPLTALTAGFNLIALPQTLSLTAGEYFFGCRFVENTSESGLAFEESTGATGIVWAKANVTSNQWTDIIDIIAFVRLKVMPGTLVGTDNIAEVNELLLFPNPTSNQLHLLVSSAKNENVNVFIHALDGKLVFNSNIESNTAHTIDVSALPQGVYFVKASSNGNSIIKKVVVE